MDAACDPSTTRFIMLARWLGRPWSDAAWARCRAPNVLVAMIAAGAGGEGDPHLSSIRCGVSTRAAPQPARSQTVMGWLIIVRNE